MKEHDESLLADDRLAFLRLLPTRTGLIGRRLARFTESGWDINGLALIHGDSCELRQGSQRYGVQAAIAPLLALTELLGEVLESETLPDPELGGRLLALAGILQRVVPPAPLDERDRFVPSRLLGEEDFDLATLADLTDDAIAAAARQVDDNLDLWGDGSRRFGQTEAAETVPMQAGPRAAPMRQASIAALAPSMPVPAGMPTTAPAATPATATSAPAPAANVASDPGKLSVPADFRVYHLSDCESLSLELDQRLESQGLDIELLEDVTELNELLSALPADLVLVDACFTAELESIGATVRLARASNSKRLMLVAIADGDDISLRLSARRAGVDALIVDPASVNDVIKRLQLLVDPAREEAFRVLIVEDDRSQALFAEGILRNAGMDSLVVVDALDVMPALKQFRPDLILMDLNMPGANGIELTALIREQEAFAHTPIVFLSGESSEDLQFDAIDAGGDDFLSKPIRPRHLISAVQTRVRRHRQQESRRNKRSDKDAATGLLYRKTLLEELDEVLRSGQTAGGLLFIEVEGLGMLRERIGLTALEILLGEVSRLLTNTAGELPATRFGDGSYLLLDRSSDESGLETFASQLRHTLMQTPFQAMGHPLRLRLSVGVCSFKHGFDESGAMINAVEKVAREARTQERGIRRFEPPRASDALKETALLTQVRAALDQDSLVLLYQPVVAVAGNDVSQYQVLLRLRDAAGKLRSAAEIIPMAERTSLIVEIDRWVMMQAMALIKERLDEGQQLRLFVTQSALTLAASGQDGWLRQELRSNGVPGASVVIELRLEDVAMHSATVHHFCTSLVSDSVQFCLSQFEGGAEAEAMIGKLPLSFVKLARKFTGNTMTPALRDELRTLIDRAHRGGLQVIGHGVEDAQAAATLWMSGIDFIQGNLVQQADQDLNFDFNQAVL